jgi:serine/threonine protein kinase
VVLLLMLLQAKPFADFLNEVLCWEPSSRASAKDLLKHPWLQDAAVDSN